MMNKGRLTPIMKQMPVFIVNSDIEVGLKGAQERARREVLSLGEPELEMS